MYVRGILKLKERHQIYTSSSVSCPEIVQKTVHLFMAETTSFPSWFIISVLIPEVICPVVSSYRSSALVMVRGKHGTNFKVTTAVE